MIEAHVPFNIQPEVTHVEEYDFGYSLLIDSDITNIKPLKEIFRKRGKSEILEV